MAEISFEANNLLKLARIHDKEIGTELIKKWTAYAFNKLIANKVFKIFSLKMKFRLDQSIEILETTPLVTESYLSTLSKDWINNNEGKLLGVLMIFLAFNFW